MQIIDTNNGIKIIIDDTYTISKGETLVETRDNFLDMMGRIFDEAIYDSLNEGDISEDEMTGGRGLRSKVMMIDEYSHIPNTVMMQMMELSKSHDSLKELADYVNGTK